MLRFTRTRGIVVRHLGALIPLFGVWLAWAYLVSLVAMYPPLLARGVDDRPSVAFSTAGETYVSRVASADDGLGGLRVLLSAPASKDLLVPVRALSEPVGAEKGAARRGVHYQLEVDAAFVVPKGATEGELRSRDGVRDVAVRSGAIDEPVRFRLELQTTADAVRAADPDGYLWVEIPALPAAIEVAEEDFGRVPVFFEKELLALNEIDVASHPLFVRTDSRLDEDAEMHFELRRTYGGAAESVAHFTYRFPRNAEAIGIRFDQVMNEVSLAQAGLLDDRAPGGDCVYELYLDARPPLIVKSDPCVVKIAVLDDDAPVELRHVLENESGDVITRIAPGEPYWIVPTLSGPMETDFATLPTRDGETILDGEGVPIAGVIPAGTTRLRFGPFVENADRIRVSPGVEGRLKNSFDASQFASDGERDGEAGGGAGDSGQQPGGKRAVVQTVSAEVPVSAEEAGAALLLLVNTKRVHEPQDAVVSQIQEAVEGEAIYRGGAIVVGREELSQRVPVVTATAGIDDDVPAFDYSAASGDTLQHVAERVADEVAFHRRAAGDDDLRAIVVWPDRELPSAEQFAAVRDVINPGRGPFSLLFPDADPGAARALATALVGDRQPSSASVRSPRSNELAWHIKDILRASNGGQGSIGKTNENASE